MRGIKPYEIIDHPYVHQHRAANATQGQLRAKRALLMAENASAAV